MTATGPYSHDGSSAPRPTLLTWVCLLGWVGIAVAAAGIVIQWRTFITLPIAYLVGAPAALLVTAAALYGYWRLRRWGLWLIAFGTATRLIATLVGAIPLGRWDLVWPSLIVVVGLGYLRRLR